MTEILDRGNQTELDLEEYEADYVCPDVRAIRETLGLTQSEFATRFGISIGSVRNWEQKRAEPDASMRSYLAVVKHNPNAVIEALERDRRGRDVRLISH